MRRAHLDSNQYGEGQYQQSNNHVAEDNEHLTGQLSDKVRALKSLSIDIGHEVRESNKFINEMDNDFDNTGGFLQKTMNRVSVMARAGHNRYICYLMLFALFVFFICWIIIKTR